MKGHKVILDSQMSIVLMCRLSVMAEACSSIGAGRSCTDRLWIDTSQRMLWFGTFSFIHELYDNVWAANGPMGIDVLHWSISSIPWKWNLWYICQGQAYERGELTEWNWHLTEWIQIPLEIDRSYLRNILRAISPFTGSGCELDSTLSCTLCGLFDKVSLTFDSVTITLLIHCPYRVLHQVCAGSAS